MKCHNNFLLNKYHFRLNLMEKLVQPCGPPPEKKSED